MWSPVLSQFEVLSSSVDRLMLMDTYNADSLAQWLAAYDNIVNNNVPREVDGIGLGCWVDSSNNGTWSVTNASAVERIAQLMSDAVPEAAMFRLVPVTDEDPSSWPEPFWYESILKPNLYSLSH